MKKKRFGLLKRLLWIYLLPLCHFTPAQTSRFPVVTKNSKATILYDNKATRLDSIAAHLLAEDIESITGYKPAVITDYNKASGNVIVIGQIGSSVMQYFLKGQAADLNKLNGQWECFGFATVKNPKPGISSALLIAGSDARGTAYGVFSLSQKIGISPWYWWADAPVKKQPELIVTQEDFISKPPSVKFRGIFINDEDWGLQPWAAKTFEPETGDIGPRTYAKVFELLLRLKANLIWPAMHPSTKAFFHYPGNVQMAEAYGIVIGSSHAEPILRNNVDEWKEKTMGHFNYLTNRDSIYKYWEDRVKESSSINAIYSIGMRGVHDGQMEGVKNMKEAVPIVERIIQDQRGLLSKYVNPDAAKVPQVLTPYKEVLEIYDNGLRVPDDVTLVWPDDNYGYIQRLNTEAEKKRAGGAGVYYHASYWGRPHDYLWLPSANPALMRNEMRKAYENGANRLWVLNVGDIKPIEYNMDLFLSMAYKADAFRAAGSEKEYLKQWAATTVDKQRKDEIANLLSEYYQLAFERRPEFMGWSQTEPTTQTTFSSYNHFFFGDEAQRRLDRYDMLKRRADALRTSMKPDAGAAFYQLVYYPIACANWMNQKFLYRDKAYLYGKQNRISAYEYASQSQAAYDSIVNETTYYNEQLSGGKWRHLMSMEPRKLPVYLPPVLPITKIEKGKGWDAVPEGYDTTAYQNRMEKKLPVFLLGAKQAYFIDVCLTDSVAVNWQARSAAPWVSLSVEKGRLVPGQHLSSVRIWVKADWNKLPSEETASATITVTANGATETIQVAAFRPKVPGIKGAPTFTEQNGYVSIWANHYSSINAQSSGKWKPLLGAGHTGFALQSIIPGKADTVDLKQRAARLHYTFTSFSQASPMLSIYTLPMHPLTTQFGMRYGVSIDDGPVQILDFKTTGRSEEWKQNVLRNAAIKEISLPALQPGQHTLSIYAIDPGVVLDRLVIRFGNVPLSYSILPETN